VISGRLTPHTVEAKQSRGDHSLREDAPLKMASLHARDITVKLARPTMKITKARFSFGWVARQPLLFVAPDTATASEAASTDQPRLLDQCDEQTSNQIAQPPTMQVRASPVRNCQQSQTLAEGPQHVNYVGGHS
jgi:hypothetical protein